jgi:hypothetical protein
MANLLMTSLTLRSIWGERFLRRRVSGYLDPLLAGRFSPAFFEKIVLTTIDATVILRRLDFVASTFFRLVQLEPPNDKNAYMFVGSAAKSLIL